MMNPTANTTSIPMLENLEVRLPVSSSDIRRTESPTLIYSIPNQCIQKCSQSLERTPQPTKNYLHYYNEEFLNGYVHGTNHKGWKTNLYATFLRVYAKHDSVSNAIDFFILPDVELSKRMCSIFPDPYLFVNCQMDVGPNITESLPWTSWHDVGSHQVRIPLLESLKAQTETARISGRETGIPWKLYQLQGAPKLPFNILEPVGVRQLRLVISVTVSFAPIGSPSPTGLNSKTASLIKKLYDSDSTKDFTISAEDGKEEVKCHSTVLMVQSPVFAAMLSPSNAGMVEFKDRRVEMNDVSIEGIKIFLKYLYFSEFPTSELTGSHIVLELFHLANKYEVKDLLDEVVSFIMTKKAEWFGPDVLLEFYFLLNNLGQFPDLKLRILQLLKGMPEEELQSCERYREMKPKDVIRLLWAMVKL